MCQTEGAGDRPKRIGELLYLRVVERAGQLGIELGNDLVDARDDVRTEACGTDLEYPPVDLASVTRDPGSLLHLVDQRDHVVAMHAEQVRELLLIARSSGADVTEHRELPRCDPQVGETVAEALGRSSPQLGEQKCDRVPVGDGAIRAGHQSMIQKGLSHEATINIVEDIMKLAVVGAAGRTGCLVVEQALARRHTVVAIARRPGRVAAPDSTVRLVEADVLEQGSLNGAFVGCDAVISTLGAGTSRRATDVYSAGVANILAAMSDAGTAKLAVISAYPAGPREERAGIGDRIVETILWRFFGASYVDMQRMEQELAVSDVSWVALRPPRLIDKQGTGSYRLGITPPRKGRSLRCADLATALLDVLDRPELYGASPYVCN